jgi:hypothetical protein
MMSHKGGDQAPPPPPSPPSPPPPVDMFKFGYANDEDDGIEEDPELAAMYT